MATIEFTHEERIANALMLHASSLDDIGLLHGKMGVALYFHRLARQTGKEVFGTFADELIDQVIEGLHAGLPIGFERGITGIGWAVEYLIQNGFVEADADEVLEELDERIYNVLIYGQDDMDAVIAIAYYHIGRLCSRIEDESNYTVLQLKSNVIYIIDALEHYMSKGVRRPELADVLMRLYELNVFNYKVAKLQQIIGSTTKYDSEIPCWVPPLDRSTDGKSIYAGYDVNDVAADRRWGLAEGIAGIGWQFTMQGTPIPYLYQRKQNAELLFWQQEIQKYIGWYRGEIATLYKTPSPLDNQKITAQNIALSAIYTWAELHQKPKYLHELALTAGVFSGKRILDVGSGAIPSALCFDGCEIYCLEPLMREYAVVGFPIEGYDRVHFINAPVEDIPIEDGFFDAIICVNAIDHVDDIEQAARELQRVAKPGALFVMNVHYHKATICEPIELNDTVFAGLFSWVNGLRRVKASRAGFSSDLPADELFVVWSNIPPSDAY